MIVLIVGDFGVGKDTVADMLVNESLRHHDCAKFTKILSYTTRAPRYENEKTHIFCSKEEFLSFDDLIAQTEIGDNFYGARKSQFDENKANLYCVDEKGVEDILENPEIDSDDILVVEVIRFKWLRNISEERMNRKRRDNPYPYPIDYRIVNNYDMDYLESSVLDCFNFIVSEMKKNL